jgi:hypothetical protein
MRTGPVDLMRIGLPTSHSAPLGSGMAILPSSQVDAGEATG